MNLNAVVMGPISAINSFSFVAYGANLGVVKNADYTRSPAYQWFYNVAVQLQPLGANEIEHVEGLNLQKNNQVVYMNGDIDGLERGTGQSGDLIKMLDGTVWLVTALIENFDTAGWSKFVITLQDDPV